MVGTSRAREILTSIGWLARQPAEFQDEVLRRAVQVQFARDEVIYRPGDAPGGIYGIVDGVVIASFAHGPAIPHLLHLLTSGDWMGEGPFLSRQPRRLELRAARDTSAVYLPLEAMDTMAARNPSVLRNFVQIVMLNIDIVMRAAHDLQDPDEHRRIARALRRVMTREDMPIPLTQSAIGMLANASRKTVNAAVRRFEQSGWVRRGYRSITITDMQRLTEFAEYVYD